MTATDDCEARRGDYVCGTLILLWRRYAGV